MKTKLFNIVTAYMSLLKLGNESINVKEAMDLFRLKKVLADHFEFYGECEKKYAEQCGGEIKEDGSIVFSDDKSKIEYIEKINELKDTDVELDIPDICIASTNINISMHDIEALDGFVKFG